MRRIWKYPLKENDVTTIVGNVYCIRAIMVQDGIPQVWIEMDDDCAEVSIDLVSVGTGWDVSSEVMECFHYVDSVIIGDYVWHYYWVYTPGGN